MLIKEGNRVVIVQISNCLSLRYSDNHKTQKKLLRDILYSILPRYNALAFPKQTTKALSSQLISKTLSQLKLYCLLQTKSRAQLREVCRRDSRLCLAELDRLHQTASQIIQQPLHSLRKFAMLLQQTIIHLMLITTIIKVKQALSFSRLFWSKR